MNLAVLSYKVCWYSSKAEDYVTFGGFPFQISALSSVLDSTTLLLLERKPPIPEGSVNISGHNIRIYTIPEPQGRDIQRKIALITWFPKHIGKIWKIVHEAEAVHTPLPGDLGTIAMLIALLQKKPLFIRHCGRWGIPSSRMDKILQRFLERIAGGRNVVMATGGSTEPPSRRNPNIQWIFATALWQQQLDSLPSAQTWQPGENLRLVTVGSLLPGKNISALIDAVPIIRKQYPDVNLDIIGTGRLLPELQNQVQSLGLAQSVRFRGNLAHADVFETLCHSHIFTFPTLYEGFPKALLEAMACGLPIIANPVSVIPSLLQNQAGVLLDRPDAQTIAREVLALLENPEKMAVMGSNARARARQYTLESWRDTIAERLEKAWGKPLKCESTSGTERQHE